MQHLVGQTVIAQRFDKLIRENKLGSAYLFSGPAGTGKSAMVLQIARRTFCEHPVSGAACGRCPACMKMSKLQHPNFHFVHVLPSSKNPSPNDPYKGMEKNKFELIRPAEEEFGENPYAGLYIQGASQILVSSIRYLIHNLSMRPSEQGKQIVFILLAEKLNKEAFNALLKTLEEPPQNTHFFITTESLYSIPITIRSRCQTVKFNPLPRQVLEKELLEKGTAPDKADRLSRLSDGSVRTMLELLESDLASEDAFILNFWRIIMGAKVAGHWVSMDDVNKLSEELVALVKSDPGRLKARFQLMIYWLRDAQQMESAGDPERLIFRHLEKEIRNFVLFYPGLPYYDMQLLLEESLRDVMSVLYKPAVMGKMLMELRMTLLEHRKT